MSTSLGRDVGRMSECIEAGKKAFIRERVGHQGRSLWARISIVNMVFRFKVLEE